MANRGGGVKDLRHRKLYELKTDSEDKDVIAVELLIDVQESMGMNVCNTVAENTSVYISEIIGSGKIGLRIASNLCTERMASAFFKIPLSNLSWKEVSGKEVAQGIINAYEFAFHDKYRASTHNKGIMNGIDAVALALGQDWRAIESSAHTYAAINGDYKPLTHYKIVKSKNGEEFLLGKIELPIACATKGGALNSNSSYGVAHMIAGNPNGRQLAGMLACVGLAQNFAAIRALSIEGIQKGHMNLHAKNIAISAGVPTDLISEAVEYMKEKGNYDVITAQEFLTTIQDISPLQNEIFMHHSYNWMLSHVILLNKFEPIPGLINVNRSKHISLRYRLRLITILIGHIVSTIHSKHEGEGIDQIIATCRGEAIVYEVSKNTVEIHNFLIEIIATFNQTINSYVKNRYLKEVSSPWLIR